jgi:hypothetical protein
MVAKINNETVPTESAIADITWPVTRSLGSRIALCHFSVML